MKVSVLTPTCNRPVALKLTERMLQRQTRQPDQWVIADGSLERIAFPDPDDRSVVVVRYPQEPGPRNFCTNVMRGLEYVNGDVVVIFEDDDWYHPTHIERMVAALERDAGLWAVGDPWQRYYNPIAGVWKVYKNIGSSLAQTAIRRAAVPALQEAAKILSVPAKIGVDRYFWDRLPNDWKLIKTYDTVVGIKGLPGQRGLGVGHRPTPDWTPDPDWSKLREWIGDDVGIYQQLATRDATAV
jgi:glycosyltransferase involved in cell wall biosynthesis